MNEWRFNAGDSQFVGFLEREGFAVVEQVLGGTALARLVDSISVVMGLDGYAMRNLLKRVPEIRSLAASPEIRSLVEPVLGAGAFPVKGILFDKTPGANWKVAWHQDTMIAVRERIENQGFEAWSIKDGVTHVQPPGDVLAGILTVRVHLDDCGEENGPLRVLAGSHRKGLLNSAELEASRGSREAVTCTVPRGGVLLMRPLTLHASSAASVPRHRRVVHLELPQGSFPAACNGLSPKALFQLFPSSLAGALAYSSRPMNFIVTAGPTIEKLDTVRRLTNFSTGRTGTEMANFLAGRGHQVTLLLGEQATWSGQRRAQKVITFSTTADLQEKLKSLSKSPVNAVLHAAAVGDFMFGKVWKRDSEGQMQEVASDKFSTRDGALLAELVPTPKLIAQLNGWFPKSQVVGWKYEVEGKREDALVAAQMLMDETKISACVANGPAYGDGFGLVTPTGQRHFAGTAGLFSALEDFVARKSAKA